MIYFTDFVNEAKSEFIIYHNSYTSAIQEVRAYAIKKGYELSDDEMAEKVGLGPAKPSQGQTNRITLTLFKSGKEQRKTLSFQVYRMSTEKFELNLYIS